MDRIHCFYIAGESIKIKVHENSTPLAMKHVYGFEYHFLDVDLSPTFYKFWIMNAIQCCFLRLLFFSCIVLSLFVFLMCLSFQGQIEFRIYSNLHGLVWGMFQSYLPLSEYKHGVGLLQCFKFLVPFCPYSFRIFLGYFLRFVDTFFFSRFLQISIPIDWLFLIINVSSELGITGYLLYP